MSLSAARMPSSSSTSTTRRGVSSNAAISALQSWRLRVALERQANPERSAVPTRARHRHVAPVGAHDGLGDEQAEAEPGDLRRRHGPLELSEDAIVIRGIDADAAVADQDGRVVALAAHLDVDRL